VIFGQGFRQLFGKKRFCCSNLFFTKNLNIELSTEIKLAQELLVQVVLMTQLNWSEWCSFKTLDFRSVPASNGVYQIRWAVNGKPKSICRAKGKDTEGILYIGEGKLMERIESFWRRIRNQGGRHTAGWTYAHYEFGKEFKQEQLEVRWLEYPECGRLEDELLLEYVGNYLDKPPLNMKIPRC